MAGLTEVKGPGVTIEMNDAKKEVPSGQDPNLFIIHDDDVLAVVNELLASGAEAIAINGQRVVATTEIRCAGAVIMINGVRFAPPLKIQAIGDPETLHNALKIRRSCGQPFLLGSRLRSRWNRSCPTGLYRITQF